MPEVRFPTTLGGWVVVLAGALVGFVSGAIAVHLLSRVVPG